MPEIEKTYKELSKKHKLPDYSALNNEFELATIEREQFIMREIIGRMVEKIDYFSALLSSIIHPDNGTLATLHELRHFDEREKQALFSLYRTLMSYNRRSIATSLLASEKDEAQFISDFFKDWMQIKPKLLVFSQTLSTSWQRDINRREELEYFG